VLVQIDLFPNETSRHADVLLPATSWLERFEGGIPMAHLRPVPHLQWVEAVAAAPGACRDDEAILAGLTRAMGRARFGSWLAEWGLRLTGIGSRRIGDWAARLDGLAPANLRAAPRGILGDVPPGGWLRTGGTDLPGGRVRLAIPEFVAALGEPERASDAYKRRATPDVRVRGGDIEVAGVSAGGDRGELEVKPDDVPVAPGACAGPPGAPLRLFLVTSVRPLARMNTWLGAIERPGASLHPDDLARLGLADGDEVRLVADGGAEADGIEVPVTADPGLRPGVVVVPWGVADTPERRQNANHLVPTTRLEPWSGQPISNGLTVLASRPAYRPRTV
jgi:anaerobic selenocysteine-containing dehydrogenase